MIPGSMWCILAFPVPPIKKGRWRGKIPVRIGVIIIEVEPVL
jgi:hypothetical protein